MVIRENIRRSSGLTVLDGILLLLLCKIKCACVCAVGYRLYKLICFDQGSVFNLAEFDGSPPTDSPSSL